MRLIYVFLIVFLISSCEEKVSAVYEIQGNAFGTTYGIQYFSTDYFNAEKGLDSVIYAVNKSVSTYLPKSDISRINAGDTTVVVDAIFKEVFRLSEEVNKTSKGYFDPTIGVLRNAYGFGDVKPIKTIDDEVLDSLMQFVGFEKIFISEEDKVIKESAEIYLDFNAVAKGYGIDCLGRYLESKGVENYLIELGGEILAKGINIAKDKPWIVGIESVNSNFDDRAYKNAIMLKNAGMASSGNYRKFRIDSVTGKKYVHTLNPLTGSAEQSDVTSATVVAATCGLADAYATALMALGLEKSKELLKVTSGIEAYITYNDSLNKEQIYSTVGFTKLLAN